LRGLVREVLREALAARKAPANGAEQVIIANDAELASFVKLLIARLDDPQTAAAIRSGRHRFTLAGAGTAPTLPQLPGPTVKGVITERTIEQHARAGTILLAPGAIVTPATGPAGWDSRSKGAADAESNRDGPHMVHQEASRSAGRHHSRGGGR
jgi:hypothetical protein